jgi:hypothetical protein
MWTRKYIIAVILVTIVTLGIGLLLWNSEEKQVLEPFEGWSRGFQDDPVTLNAFADFT